MRPFSIVRGWCVALLGAVDSFLHWLTEPSPEDVARAERDRKARALKAAREGRRG